MKTRGQRNRRGGTIAEFGAAFVVLVLFFFVPLINLSFIAVRSVMASGVVVECVHRLAMSEKRSEAYALLDSDEWLNEFISKCGVKVVDTKLTMVICGKNDADKIGLDQGQKVPAEYLPGGAKSPCVYNLELVLKTEIPPVYTGGPSIPGITAPIPMQFCGRSSWENLTKNPDTKEYYVNE